MIKTVLTIRNLVIFISLVLAAFIMQTKRIGWLKVDVVELKASLDEAKSANDDAISTITKLQAANEQCALDRKYNSTLNEELALKHQEHIYELKNETEKLRQEISALGGCVNYRISPDVIKLLQKRHDS